MSPSDKLAEVLQLPLELAAHIERLVTDTGVKVPLSDNPVLSPFLACGETRLEAPLEKKSGNF
jgi:hypothetical protein